MARMKQRRRSAAEWTSTDEVLLPGEFGVETDTLLVKVGDGTSAWTDLGYVGSDTAAVAAVAADLATEVTEREAADTALDAAIAASEAAAAGTYVAGSVYEPDGVTIAPTKRLSVVLTADGTDIEDLIIEDV